MGEGGGGEEKVSSLSFSLPSFPFSPETPDTQASQSAKIYSRKNFAPQAVLCTHERK